MKRNREEYNKQYYQNNKEQFSKNDKLRYMTNKQKILASCKRYNDKNKDIIAIKKIKYAYGISYEQLKQMFVSQEGKCAICEFKFITRRDVNVDHNHTTKQVRQLLCPNCNLGLGHFKEDISKLSKAIAYLNKWNQ